MYPATGFHFQVVFQGIDDPKGVDSGFLSVGGLKAVAEAGVGSGVVSGSPDWPAFSVLILKRAVRPYAESALTRWFFSDIRSVGPLPQARVDLLDESHKPYMSWLVYDLTPKSWELNELNSERSEVLIETIELYYGRLEWGGIR